MSGLTRTHENHFGFKADVYTNLNTISPKGFFGSHNVVIQGLEGQYPTNQKMHLPDEEKMDLSIKGTIKELARRGAQGDYAGHEKETVASEETINSINKERESKNLTDQQYLAKFGIAVEDDFKMSPEMEMDLKNTQKEGMTFQELKQVKYRLENNDYTPEPGHDVEQKFGQAPEQAQNQGQELQTQESKAYEPSVATTITMHQPNDDAVGIAQKSDSNVEIEVNGKAENAESFMDRLAQFASKSVILSPEAKEKIDEIQLEREGAVSRGESPRGGEFVQLQQTERGNIRENNDVLLS